METPPPKKQHAWQPLTPRGIGLFTRASVGRLLLVQFLFAIVMAAAVIWFFVTNWFPVVSRAIKRFPEHAEVRSGKLDWGGDSPALLAENRFLAISVDLNHEGQARSPAHLAIELGQSNYKTFSLLGYEAWKYPAGWKILLGRDDAAAWWGAWSPAILAITAAAVIVSSMIFWAALASIYTGPCWLAAFFANRDLTAKGSWKLAGAALMPGSLFLTAVILGYGAGWFGLIGLALASVLHLVIGWIYLILSVLKLPLHVEARTADKNPFAPPSTPPSPPPESSPTNSLNVPGGSSNLPP